MLLALLLAAAPSATCKPVFSVLLAKPEKQGRHPGSWVTNDDYPNDATRLGLEGSVEFELQVDAFGCPTACTITKSSAFAILDDASCALLMRRAHFSPAEDASGKRIPAVYRNRFRWALGDRPVRAIAPWRAQAEARFGADGKLVSCKSSGTGERFGVAQFCKFATAVRDDAVAAARGAATGPYTIGFSGAASFDGASLSVEAGEGTPIAQASVAFAIYPSGDSHQSTIGDGEAGLLYNLALLHDLYASPRDEKGRPAERQGMFAIRYWLAKP
jgi:TonB family protein